MLGFEYLKDKSQIEVIGIMSLWGTTSRKSAVLSATSADGSGASARYEVTVYPEPC
jgi:hypothetical protein